MKEDVLLAELERLKEINTHLVGRLDYMYNLYQSHNNNIHDNIINKVSAIVQNVLNDNHNSHNKIIDAVNRRIYLNIHEYQKIEIIDERYVTLFLQYWD